MQVEVINVDKKARKKPKNHNKKVKYAFGIKKGKEQGGLEDIMKEGEENKQQHNEEGLGMQETKKGGRGKKDDSSSSENESEKENIKKKKMVERNKELKMAEI